MYLTNFTGYPLTLRRLEVLEADPAVIEPVATFEGKDLDALLQPVGGSQDGKGTASQIEAGRSLVVFMWVPFEPGAHVSSQLRHRLVAADATTEGAVIGTHHTELKVLRSPVSGSDWRASDAPSNDQENHHRRGIVIVGGHSSISRRYAIDWMQVENGASFSGDARDKRAYYSYGKPVAAVADATVVTARDGLPDNVPGHNEQFHPAIPITMDTVTGNTIGEGLPYVIDHFRVKSENGWESRTRELPLKDMVIDFGQ